MARRRVVVDRPVKEPRGRASRLAQNVIRIELVEAESLGLTGIATRRRLLARFYRLFANRGAGRKLGLPSVSRRTWYRTAEAAVGRLRALRDYPNHRQLELWPT